MASRDKILIGVAWPYANGEQHIGHIAGAYLPPDVFARFHRMRGSDVVMVSGSDTHGTPVTVKADEEGVTPPEIIARYHPKFIESYLGLGLTFDLFTHTDTATHWETTHDFFRRHLERGYLHIGEQEQLYDPEAQQFLPDRYVEGTCPRCGFADARGDQCDNCGSIYEATELGDPRSKITGNRRLEVRRTTHFFLDLGKLNEPLLAWIADGKAHWRTNVLNFTRSQLEERKLRGRPITRDITWGVTIPVPGYDEKRIYVWYDAVIGYLSATKEWARLTGHPDAWRERWETPAADAVRHYYFIGKDNIPFHTIIWPGMLIGYGGLALPFDVPSNEYLNTKGRKLSKSRGNVIAIRSVLERYQADAWRYALTSMAPETSDVDFTWDDFVERVNNELIATWGNLVNRVVSFAASRFDGAVPTPGPLADSDARLLAEIRTGFTTVGELYGAVKLKAAAGEVRRLAQLANLYVTERAPFSLIKTDRAAAGTVVHTALQAIAWLNTLWAPILPHASQSVHAMLGFEGALFGRQFTETVDDARGSHLVLRYDHTGAVGRWEPVDLPGGQRLGTPAALFTKLDPATAEREASPDPS